MNKFHPKNERLKRQYYLYLEHALGLSDPSVDSAAKAINRFDECNGFKDFSHYHFEQARAFKRHLGEQKSLTTGKPLSKSTQSSTLAALKKFFTWLAGQPGYRSRLTYSDAQYFTPSDKDRRVASATRYQRSPTIEQIRHVLASMPSETVIDRRDKALIAFAILTGARDGALATFKLKHVDLVEQVVFQDAREVATKNSKTFETFFFPVGDDISQIVADWVECLVSELLWSYDDPLFPATEVALGQSGLFESAGLARKHWSGTTPIRRIFRNAFEGAGLPYSNPHSFRRTLTLIGQKACKSPEALKAWSQNLGHEKVLTTLMNYGNLPSHRQGEIIKEMASDIAA